MPRQARLDFPGAVSHVMARGVARQRIFRNREDFAAFAGLLGDLVGEAGAQCLAWALLPNHVHLLVRTGGRSLTWMMQRLLLRYSIYFNGRYRRVGHVFQNRFKSVICQRDRYLRELVRYVHLNPLRAGRVANLARLRKFPWCGHGALLGAREAGWQETGEVLSLFGSERARARKEYASFIEEGVPRERGSDWPGGDSEGISSGLAGEWAPARRGEKMAGDQRILGSGEFVAKVLREVEHRDRRKMDLRRRIPPREAVARAAREAGVEVRRVYGRDRSRGPAKARALACKWLVEDLGVRVSSAAKLLGVTPAAICYGVIRGRKIEKETGVRLGRRTS